MVSHSSVEVEYWAMANATSEVIWIHNLLILLKIPVTPAIVFCDNQTALRTVANPVFHERTKHIEVDCHFVRERLPSDVICICYAPTTEQLGNIFTKALGQHQFQFLGGKLGVSNLHALT